MKRERKTKDYWRSLDNVVRELQPVVKKLGRFPTQSDLRELGLSSLNLAISGYHGGVINIAPLLGFEPEMRPRGYWREWENVEGELEDAIREIGHFPSHTELQKIRKSSLAVALTEHRKIVSAYRRKHGYEADVHPQDYWISWRNLESEVNDLIKRLGHFPSSDELRKMKRFDICDSMFTHHGGIRTVRKKMGYKDPIKPAGYWQKWTNVKRELQRIIKEAGHFPIEREFRKLGHTVLGGVVYGPTFGGINAVRERLGYNVENQSKGYWQEWKNVEEELRRLTKKHGQFPSGKMLNKLGKSGLLTALNRDFGGMRAVREKLGYDHPRAANGYWQEWTNVEREVRSIINELGHFPTYNDFRKHKKSSVYVAIKQHHGGIISVAERFGFRRESMPRGYWENWDNVQNKLESVVQELGHFPSNEELIQRGFSMLAAAIARYHGGKYAVRERMGMPTNTKPAGYWQEWANTEKELNESIRLLGHFPTQDELRSLGRFSLVFAIHRYHGGFPEVCKRFGYPTLEDRQKEQLEDLLKGYVGQ